MSGLLVEKESANFYIHSREEKFNVIDSILLRMVQSNSLLLLAAEKLNLLKESIVQGFSIIFLKFQILCSAWIFQSKHG